MCVVFGENLRGFGTVSTRQTRRERVDWAKKKSRVSRGAFDTWAVPSSSLEIIGGGGGGGGTVRCRFDDVLKHELTSSCSGHKEWVGVHARTLTLTMTITTAVVPPGELEVVPRRSFEEMGVLGIDGTNKADEKAHRVYHAPRSFEQPTETFARKTGMRDRGPPGYEYNDTGHLSVSAVVKKGTPG